MSPIVMKFGGTSVGGAAAIVRVAEIVRSAAARHAVTVVVSAMSRVTDTLLSACEAAERGHLESLEGALADLRTRHLEVVEHVVDPPDVQAFTHAIDEELRSLRTILESIAVLREATPRARDRVAAAGELLSSRIVAAVLTQQGARAEWIDARWAIVTDERHGCAAPLFGATSDAVAAHVRPSLESGSIPVLGGFIGATAAGVTTTLGRGGSDYSAAVVGAALDADEIQIWTDVDGMLTADPRILSEAQLVTQLSFGEASELAYFGAKVLHPSTILPAVERGIPVRILNTMRPHAPGSLITAEATRDGRPLAAIACKRNLTVIDVTSTRMLMAHGFLRRLFEVFERYETSVDVVTTSEVSVSITVDDDRRLDAIVRELEAFSSVQIERGMAIVAAVGDELRLNPAASVRIIAALDGLPLRMVSQAGCRRNLTVVVRDEHVGEAMTRLHASFFAAVAA